MDAKVLEKLREEHGDNEDLIQLYEEWGDSPCLREVFRLLDAHEPDWALERELGSWAAEFILDMLLEYGEELEGMAEEERTAVLREEIEERYADFRACHQFARVNNLSARFEEDGGKACGDLEAYVAEDGERTGFPRL